MVDENSACLDHNNTKEYKVRSKVDLEHQCLLDHYFPIPINLWWLLNSSLNGLLR